MSYRLKDFVRHLKTLKPFKRLLYTKELVCFRSYAKERRKNMIPVKTYLNTAELTEFLSISKATLHGWERKLEDFPPRYLVAGTPYFNVEEINAWIATKATKVTKAASASKEKSL